MMTLRTMAMGTAVLWTLAVCLSLHAVQDEDRETPRLDPGSNPHTVLVDIYYQSGYSLDDSVTIATRLVHSIQGKRIEPVEVNPSRDTDVLPLDPDSNPHALLLVAFYESGWSIHDSLDHANAMVMRLRGVMPMEGELMPLGEVQEWVYPAAILKCENGLKTRSFEYINGLCYESLAACEAVACGPDEAHRYTLTLGGDAVCITDKNLGGAFVDSSLTRNKIECDDFESTECGAISVSCCDEANGCAGCPDCD